MEELTNHNTFSGSPSIASAYIALEDILNSKSKTAIEKCTAWRQQSLVLKGLEQMLVEDLMERHWDHHRLLIESSEDSVENMKALLGNNDYNMEMEFPIIDCMDLPKERNVDVPMFEERHLNGNHIQNGNDKCSSQNATNNNKSEGSVYRPRNTMENFLQGKVPAADSPPGFSSARQLLAMQNLKKKVDNEPLNQQHDLSSRCQKSNVGFNFAATKKSLGSMGRVINSNRKNFVSPIRSKSVLETDTKGEENINTETALALSHPLLKNVEPKMVELITNEIIHKFKPIDWDEIAGLDYAKTIIKEAVVYPLLRPDIFTGLRRPPKGILLFGPPGTGKTLIGKCIASQSSSTFFSISSSSLTSKWMGEGEKMVRALFAVAITRQPSVIFIDEIDSILSQRSENENEGTRRLKTEFLVHLDGAATSDEDRVLIVGATNRPQELDEAVRRRFVKRLYVPLPEKEARAEILRKLLKTVANNLDPGQIDEVSQLAEGFSGADMDTLCREASMEPLRSLPAEAIITFQKENLRHVNIDDFYTALKKVRPSVSQSDLHQYVEWNKTYGSSF